MNLRPTLRRATGWLACCQLFLALRLALAAADIRQKNHDISPPTLYGEVLTDGDNVGINAQDEIAVCSPLPLNASLRYDWNSNFGDTWNPRIATIYNPWETVNARTVSVERLTRLRDARHLDLLFVTRSKEGKIPAVLRQVGRAPVLTVGETQDFAAAGGCLNFIRQAQHVRFEVNLQATERSGLKSSSKLASMAKVVQPPKEDE